MEKLHSYEVHYRLPGDPEPQSCVVTVPGPLAEGEAVQIVHLGTEVPADQIEVLSFVERLTP